MLKLLPINHSEILKIYKETNPFTHKGIQGHAMIIGGSYGKIGSISLASKACLKTGCGLVTVFIPKCGYTIIQTSNPEVMVLTDQDEEVISEINFDFKPQAIGIGPGLGQSDKSHNALHLFLKTYKIPMVIDADALNIISKFKKLLIHVEPKTIITPHPKELQLLIGSWTSEKDKLNKSIAFSKEHQIIIVMKGSPSRVIDGETVYENTTGNAALATAGSGDVLTGMITSLLAQLYPPLHAALIGVYLHGLTADIALPDTGNQSFIASDIIAHIGKAFLSLKKEHKIN
jgi:ADP-dependent NAD(P)H-hydrate dehydratase